MQISYKSLNTKFRVVSWKLLRECGLAEAAEYRREVRKRKQQVYEQYLERRAMLRDFNAMAAFMASDAWAAVYSERLARCCRRSCCRHICAAVKTFLMNKPCRAPGSTPWPVAARC